MSDLSHAHPNRCHWAPASLDICGKPTTHSLYFDTPGTRSDWFANACDEHARATIEQKIDARVTDRWTGQEIWRKHPTKR